MLQIYVYPYKHTFFYICLHTYIHIIYIHRNMQMILLKNLLFILEKYAYFIEIYVWRKYIQISVCLFYVNLPNFEVSL